MCYSVMLSSRRGYLKCSPRLSLTQIWGQLILDKVFFRGNKLNNINEVFSLPIPWFTMSFDLSEHWATFFFQCDQEKNTVEFHIFEPQGKAIKSGLNYQKV